MSVLGTTSQLPHQGPQSDQPKAILTASGPPSGLQVYSTVINYLKNLFYFNSNSIKAICLLRRRTRSKHLGGRGAKQFCLNFM